MASEATGDLLDDDGGSLKSKLRRSERAARLRAFALVAPLLAFILLTFVIPIVGMLFRSVENNLITENLPLTVIALQDWDEKSGELPDEAVYQAFNTDITAAIAAKLHTRIGTRLNYETSGMSSLFRGLQRDLRKIDQSLPLKEQYIAADKDWGDLKTWATMKTFSHPLTAGYFLRAADLERTPDGIASVPEREQIYIKLFIRTAIMSLSITFFTFLLGYPIAWLLANLRAKTANLLLILVLLPFWTSLLVRTSAWKVLLQREGVINDFLVWIGVITDEGRLIMINNWIGTEIAMTHILLPFMILPLYSVMKTISPTYLRAAKSLGATNWTAFWRVYFPQSVPGIGAGAILVFILAIGYYITPALVGGSDGIFISDRIAYHIKSSLNWGLAAALGTILLVLVLALYWIYDRIIGIDNVKLG